MVQLAKESQVSRKVNKSSNEYSSIKTCYIVVAILVIICAALGYKCYRWNTDGYQHYLNDKSNTFYDNTDRADLSREKDLIIYNYCDNYGILPKGCLEKPESSNKYVFNQLDGNMYLRCAGSLKYSYKLITIEGKPYTFKQWCIDSRYVSVEGVPLEEYCEDSFRHNEVDQADLSKVDIADIYDIAGNTTNNLILSTEGIWQKLPTGTLTQPEDPNEYYVVNMNEGLIYLESYNIGLLFESKTRTPVQKKGVPYTFKQYCVDSGYTTVNYKPLEEFLTKHEFLITIYDTEDNTP